MIDLRAEITEAKRRGDKQEVRALQLRQIEQDKIVKQTKIPKVMTP